MSVSQKTDPTVCIVGMGYVGLTLGVVAADVGLRVHGLEIRSDIRDTIMAKQAHFFERGINQMLARVVDDGRLTVTKTLPDEADVDIYVVTVGTPLDPDGKARLDMVESVATMISERLKDGDTVIMRSTVKLGTTRRLVRPILEKSGKRFHLAFCPERTVEGKALAELRELPQIVGADCLEDAQAATRLFRNLTHTIQVVSSLETAEMIKLVDNVSRDVNFAFANEVALLCDEFGVSAHEVIRTANTDYERTNVALPGPVAGPCLSKDPHILYQSLRPEARNSVLASITRAGRATNEYLADYAARQVAELLGEAGNVECPVVSLLGLAFKGRPETGDLRGSMAHPILEALRARLPGAEFRGYDPIALPVEVEEWGLPFHDRMETALDGAHVGLILNNHPVFERMDVSALSSNMAKPSLIYDFWSHFRAKELALAPGVRYVSFGNRSESIAPEMTRA